MVFIYIYKQYRPKHPSKCTFKNWHLYHIYSYVILRLKNLIWIKCKYDFK